MLTKQCPCYTFSDVTDEMADSRVLLEVWDWDRYTANDFIGGFSIRVGEIVQSCQEVESLESWYKLLDEKQMKTKFERILADEDAQKVPRAVVYQARPSLTLQESERRSSRCYLVFIVHSLFNLQP